MTSKATIIANLLSENAALVARCEDQQSDIATLEQEIRQVRARLKRVIEEHEDLTSVIKLIRTWAYCDSLHNKHVVDLCDKTLEKIH